MATKATLISPLDGTIVPLEKVPDPVFSEHMLGNGLAILPTSQTVFAPMDGQITNINPALHALVITNGKLELLIHVGLESVSLKGEGFKLAVQKGQTVKAGQQLLSFDLNILTKKAASPLVLLVITSSSDAKITPLADGFVKTGLPLFSAEDTSTLFNTLSSLDISESKPIMLLNPNGLHARPAALIAHLAVQHPYLVEICKGNQCADAKSIVGLMGLGLAYKDQVVIRVFGPKEPAQKLLAQLKQALQNGLQETLPERPKDPVFPDDNDDFIQGLCACNGLAAGPAFLLKSQALSFEENALDPQAECRALEEALQTLGEQMEKRLAEEKNPVSRDILNAHLLLLKDPLLANNTRQTILQGKTAAFAFNSAIRRSVDILKQTNNRFLMERIADLKDLRREVLCQLTGQQRRTRTIPSGSIVVAEEILPSDVSTLPADTAGVLLAGGSPTAHASILLRNRAIPAIVRGGKKVLDIAPQTTILLDADAAKAVVAPSAEQQQAFEERIRHTQELNQQNSARAQEPAVTQDGVRIYVEGNIANPEEASRVYAAGAEGVGLVRTEFLFHDRPFVPTEEEQLCAYQAILDAIPGKAVTFRLLDAGGDKPMPFVQIPPEENPIVGIRGVRALKSNESFFRTQLRALLRLQPQERVRIMLPMVSFEQEITRFKKIFQEEAFSLGISKPAQLGIMIEVPSAALLASRLARETDFFSIGTNDLTQYTLAIDRNHKELSPLADALHPAVLQLIDRTCQGAMMYKKPVCVCGAMAGEPAAIPLLIGLGVTHLAVSAGVVARTKALIRSLSYKECHQLATDALNLPDAQAVRNLAQQLFSTR